MKLGRVVLMSVSQVRLAAKQALLEMASGINPNLTKAEKRVRGITLANAIEQVRSEKSSVLKKRLFGITAKFSSDPLVTGGTSPLDRLQPKTLPSDTLKPERASKNAQG